MAVELKNRFEADLGVVLPLVQYLDGSESSQLASILLDRLGPLTTAVAAADREIDGAEATEVLDRLEDLSEDEIDRLLARMAVPGGEGA